MRRNQSGAIKELLRIIAASKDGHKAGAVAAMVKKLIATRIILK